MSKQKGLHAIKCEFLLTRSGKVIPYENSGRESGEMPYKITVMSETECDDNQPDRSDTK